MPAVQLSTVSFSVEPIVGTIFLNVGGLKSRYAEEYCPMMQPESLSQCGIAAGVLQEVLKAQKLDKLDIEGVHALYLSLQGLDTFTRDLPNETPDTSEYINEMRHLSSVHAEQKATFIRDYLIAATAKDCCIMIAWQYSDLENTRGDMLNIHFAVRVADLDFKPLSKLDTHYGLDRDILKVAHAEASA